MPAEASVVQLPPLSVEAPLFRSHETSAHLIIHGKQRYIGQILAVQGMSSRLQKVLQALIALIEPGQGEEVGIIDGPVRYRRFSRSILSMRVSIERQQMTLQITILMNMAGLPCDIRLYTVTSYAKT